MANPSYPSATLPAHIRIKSHHQTLASVGQNLSTYVTDRGGHRWGFELDYAPLTRAQWSPIWAFLVSMRGRFAMFDFTLPNHTHRGAVANSESITVKSTTLAGSREVTCQGFTASQTNSLRAGDFIKFASGSKVYMITSDVNSDASGECLVDIEPALDKEAVANTAVSFTPIFQVAKMTDNVEVDFNTALHYGYSVEFIET